MAPQAHPPRASQSPPLCRDLRHLLLIPAHRRVDPESSIVINAGPGAGERARSLLVLDAVRSERITWRAGAAALGLAPSVFLDVARDHGVPIVRVDPSDLDADFATLDRLTRQR